MAKTVAYTMVVITVFNAIFMISNNPERDDQGYVHWALIWLGLNAGIIALCGLISWACHMTKAMSAMGEAAKQQLKK